MSLPHSIHVVNHPLVQHKLTKMRDKQTSSANFRRLLREMGLLLGYDATRDLPMGTTKIETPITAMEAPLLDGKKLVIVPILRAGLGLAEGVLDLVPLARMGHVGLYRDPKTLQAVEYYFKMPGDITDRDDVTQRRFGDRTLTVTQDEQFRFRRRTTDDGRTGRFGDVVHARTDAESLRPSGQHTE